MRVATIEAGTVTSISEINRPIADFPEVNYVEAGTEVVKGFTYDGTVFTPYAEYQAEQDELAATEYSRLRKAKYDLLNQDEMRYDDLVNNTTTWRDGIAAIKTAHPKP